MKKNKNYTCGIYKILNNVNGQFYVGSSVKIEHRWAAHLRSLRKGTHHNILLQRSWSKYGENSFSFIIVEIVKDPHDLLLVEQRYLDSDELKLNIGKKASGGDNITNHPNREEIIKKITEASKISNSKNREHYSIIFKGENNPNYGNKWNNEQKRK